MDLYLDKLPELEEEFRKEAAFGARLSETAENWAQELTSELYKQLPYLSDYDVNVNLDRVDSQRGYGFGYADVANKTERPEVEHDAMGIPHVRVPLVIQERSVKPFSIFLDGESVLPLNEDRLRETLFNPGTFDLSAHQPRDPSLVEPLMPPTRSGAGYGGEYKMASVQKEAFLGINKTTFSKGFGGLMKTNPNSEELNQAFALYKQKTGKDPSANMTYADIDTYVQQVRGKSKKASFNPKLAKKYLVDTYRNGLKKGLDMSQFPGGKQIAAELAAEGSEVASKGALLATKTAGVDLLHAIAPTLRESDIERFINKIASDPSIRQGLERAGVAQDLVDVIDNTKRASADERLAYIADSIEPTVVTIHKFPGGEFLVKSANVNALNPQDMQGQVVPGQEAAQAIGPQNAEAMMPGQTATVTAQPIDLEEPYESKAKHIEEFGEYKVTDAMGNMLMGWVFPFSLAWDGAFTKSPIAIFSNGSAFAMQDSIAGELIGKSTSLPSQHPPVGEGVFYTSAHGNAICTQPITVKSTMAGPDGSPKIIATDAMGQQLTISQMEGLSQPQRVSDIEYAFPKSWNFMRLNNQTQLQGGGQDMTQEAPGDAAADPAGAAGGKSAPKAGGKPAGKKPAEKKNEKKPAEKAEKPTVQVNVGEQAKKEKTSAVLWFNGGYNIAGGCGLDKLAADYRFDMSPVDAEFMLGLLGVDGITAKQKVAEARRKGSVKLAGLKTITLLSERYKEAEKTASAMASKIPDLRRDLVKEAATLDDKSTVNNLLALNFINPENLNSFLSYVPELEETAERLAEMQLFSYLGMNQLPEGAVNRAMNNLEEVLTNLKALAEAPPQMEE